jgi:hypothetical protein
MTRGHSRSWVTVEDVIRQKEEMLRTDPDYRAAVEAAEAKRQAAAQARRDASRPILKDLNEAGIHITSLWVTDEKIMPYSTSLPILLAHLEKGGYPDEIMQVIAHRLGVKPGIEYWDRLRDLYYRQTGEAARDGLAATLAKIATRPQFDELVELLHDESLGDSRVLLIRGVVRVGRERGKEIVRALVDDPVLGKEATARARRWK